MHFDGDQSHNLQVVRQAQVWNINVFMLTLASKHNTALITVIQHGHIHGEQPCTRKETVSHNQAECELATLWLDEHLVALNLGEL